MDEFGGDVLHSSEYRNGDPWTGRSVLVVGFGNSACDELGMPLVSGAPTALPGLYFCGLFVSPSGMLREIGLEARRISRFIASG